MLAERGHGSASTAPQTQFSVNRKGSSSSSLCPCLHQSPNLCSSQEGKYDVSGYALHSESFMSIHRIAKCMLAVGEIPMLLPPDKIKESIQAITHATMVSK